MISPGAFKVKLDAEIKPRLILLESEITTSVAHAEKVEKSFDALASSILPAEIRFAEPVTVRFVDND